MRCDRNHLIENRHIRLFLSSTFQDLQDERDYLMRRTFPELRKIAAERDVTLTELDLRWGITEEEAQSGKVVEICLREIENSIPFFIGIIGNRYGWCPSVEDINRSTYDRFEQVEGYVERHLSVTEMEMQFGVLERPENMNASFYLSQREIAIEDVDAHQKLSLLKETIKHNGRYPVAYFSSKEDLANEIKTEFIQLLNTLFPIGDLSPVEKFRIEQQSFKNQLCQSYVPEEKIFSTLDRWLDDWTSQAFVVTGESGIGKSALIANWIERIKKNGITDYELVYFFIGTGGGTNNSDQVLSIVCTEIRDRYKALLSNYDMDEHVDLNELFLKIAESGKKLVLVLDGINQLEDNQEKNLNWLPFPPKNVKILISTLPNDPTMKILQGRRYPVFVLQSMDYNKKGLMIETYLGKFAKKLTEKQISTILNSPICSNTLVLRTLLDELVNYGLFEKIDERIEYYVKSESVEDFYISLLNSYENEFGFEFVRDVLISIAISQHGLSENELLGILDIKHLNWSQFYCSFIRNFNLSEGLISFSHQYLTSAVCKKYLSKKNMIQSRQRVCDWFNSNPSGHSITEIPYQLFEMKQSSQLFDYLSSYIVFSYLFSYDNVSLRKYWNYLNQTDSVKYSFDIYRTGNTAELDNEFYANTLNQIGFFVENNYSKYDLALFCYEKSLRIRQEVLGEHNVDTAISYNNLGTVNLELGKYDEAINMYLSALRIRKELFGELSSEVATTYNNIGTVYENIDCSEAIPYLKKALNIRKKLYGEYNLDVASSYNNIASAYSRMHNYKGISDKQLIEARSYLETAIKIQLGLVGELNENTAAFYSNLSLICTYLRDYDNAILFCQKSIDIHSALFIDGHPSLAHNYINMGGLYSMTKNYQQSLFYYEKALNIRQELFGEYDRRVADVLVLLGNNYSYIGETDKALSFFFKAVNVYEMYGDNNVEINSAISDTYNGIGFSYYILGENDQAISFYIKALEIQKTIPEHSQDVGFEAILINNIARAYFKKGDIEKAFIEQEKALKMQLKIYGEESIDVARSYNNIGLIYLKTNDFDKAYEYLYRALNVRISLTGDNRLDIADSNVNIGDLLYKKGEYRDSINHYSVAYNYYVEIFGKQNIKTRDVYKKILKAKMKKLF